MLQNIQDGPFYVGSEKLPADMDDGLLRGEMYALKTQAAATRLLVINHALIQNLLRGIHCTIVTQFSSEQLISRFQNEKLRLFLDALNDGRLRIFSPIGDYRKNIFRFGPERFLKELEGFSGSHAGFIIFDQADLLFTVDDCNIVHAQAQAYLEWMRATQNIALFLVPDSVDLAPEGNCFQTLANFFRGIAGLYMFRSKLEVGIDFWTTQSCTILSQPLAVTTNDDGMIAFRPLLAVNRRNRHRSGLDDVSVETKVHRATAHPEQEKKYACDPNEWVHTSEVANIVSRAGTVYSGSRTGVLKSVPGRASQPPVQIKKPLKERVGRIALVAVAFLALGTLAFSFRNSDEYAIVGGLKSFPSWFALAVAQPNKMAKETLALPKEATIPKSESATPDGETVTYDATPGSAMIEMPVLTASASGPTPASVKQARQQAVKVAEKLVPATLPAAATSGEAVSSDRILLADLPQKLEGEACPAQLKALQLCKVSSQ